MMHMGVEGYENAIDRIHQAFNRAKCFVQDTPGICFPAPPDLCIIAITAAEEITSSSPIEIFALATIMNKRGGNPFTSASPNCMALCLGAQHGDTDNREISLLLQEWMNDVRYGVQHLQDGAVVPLEGNAAVYGAANSLPDPLLETLLRRYTDITLTVKARQSK